tara:strand:- start:119 stop:613 length:495 start_codon:yes stop_codon:yes gene_type:complete
MPKLPTELKLFFVDCINECKENLASIKNVKDISKDSIKLIKETIRYYTYLHNADIPKAKLSLVKIEAIWQDIHYMVTFETDRRSYTCVIADVGTDVVLDNDNDITGVKRRLDNSISIKDTENSLNMGDAMIKNMNELKFKLKNVIMVLDAVKKNPNARFGFSKS